ncbi:MAG: Holliday junction branch migration protein RuvA [Candidatus Gracilibacteria bacterium]|nr:Holliday junction branch migration protein RuvA [Candidatus Gracilibacteria bacterium]
MISYIKGIIKNIDLISVIVLPESGIGYEIIINELVYADIYDKKEVELFLYHNITENGQNLFGFLDFEDRILFKELIKISGVGGRVAQNILSLGRVRLAKAIMEDDKKTIESIKGVGKKMAEKIVLELNDKDIIKYNNFQSSQKGKIQINSNIKSDLKNEILSTLSLMGYNPKKVGDILDNLPKGFENLDEIIPYIIKSI